MHLSARGAPRCTAVHTIADDGRITAPHLALRWRESGMQMFPPLSQLESTTTAALVHNTILDVGPTVITDDILPASTGAGWAGARSAVAGAGADTLAESQVNATSFVHDVGSTPCKRKQWHPKGSRNKKQSRSDPVDGVNARHEKRGLDGRQFTPTEVIKLAEARVRQSNKGGPGQKDGKMWKKISNYLQECGIAPPINSLMNNLSTVSHDVQIFVALQRHTMARNRRGHTMEVLHELNVKGCCSRNREKNLKRKESPLCPHLNT